MVMAYALTCTAACSVQALLSDASCLTVLETENSGQYIFVAVSYTHLKPFLHDEMIGVEFWSSLSF